MTRTPLLMLTFAAALAGCGPLRFPELPPDGSIDGGSSDAAVGAEDATTADALAAEDSEPSDAIGHDADLDDLGPRDAGIKDGGSTDADGGPPSDGGTVTLDAEPAPDAELAVHVTAIQDGQPISGLQVMFQAGDGHLVSSELTDSSGSARGYVGDEGMITYGELGERGNYTFYTLAGVTPGDDLVLTPRFASADTTIEASYPAAFSGATSYQVSVGCTSDQASGANIARLRIPRRCASSQGRVTLLATARDGSGQVLAFSTLNDAALTLGSTTAMSLPSWRSDFSGFAFSATNRPSGYDNGDIYYTQRYGGYSYNSIQQHVSAGATASYPQMFAQAPTLGPMSERALSMSLQNNSAPDATIGAIVRLTATETATTVDLGQANMGTLSFNRVDASVPSRPVLQWNAPASVASSGDLTFIAVLWSAPSGAWIVFARPAATNRFRLPELSAELAPFGPSGGSQFNTPVVVVYDLDTVSSFDEFKSRPFPGTLPSYRRLRWSGFNFFPVSIQ